VNFEKKWMATMNRITSGLGVLATVIIIGGIALFAGDFAIKTPMQWYKGKCSEEYTRQYRAKFQWFQPTCVLPDDDESAISEDDINELQDRLADLKLQIEKTERLLKNSKKKMEERR
jgi:hypothetical protein